MGLNRNSNIIIYNLTIYFIKKLSKDFPTHCNELNKNGRPEAANRDPVVQVPPLAYVRRRHQTLGGVQKNGTVAE